MTLFIPRFGSMFIERVVARMRRHAADDEAMALAALERNNLFWKGPTMFRWYEDDGPTITTGRDNVH